MLVFGAFFGFLRMSSGVQFLYGAEHRNWKFGREYRNPARVAEGANATQNAISAAVGTGNPLHTVNAPVVPEDNYSSDGKFPTHRVGCQAYPKGRLSCAISGIACVEAQRPLIYLVDDTRRNGERVESDRWCDKRHISADSRYFGPRVWPPVEYFGPRHSCLNAEWRTTSFLRGIRHNSDVSWVDDISVIDLDYINNNHNNQYLKDIVWLLDVALWQKNIRKSSTLPNNKNSYIPQLFNAPKHILFPQDTSEFVKQTNCDVNRMNLAIVLGLDAGELYRGQKHGREFEFPSHRRGARTVFLTHRRSTHPARVAGDGRDADAAACRDHRGVSSRVY